MYAAKRELVAEMKLHGFEVAIIDETLLDIQSKPQRYAYAVGPAGRVSRAHTELSRTGLPSAGREEESLRAMYSIGAEEAVEEILADTDTYASSRDGGVEGIFARRIKLRRAIRTVEDASAQDFDLIMRTETPQVGILKDLVRLVAAGSLLTGEIREMYRICKRRFNVAAPRQRLVGEDEVLTRAIHTLES